MQDALLHRAETAAVIIIYAAAVFAALVYAAILYWKAHEHETDYRREEDTAPECIKTCVNVHAGCKEREEECLRYEPRRARKRYNPHTGEVG